MNSSRIGKVNLLHQFLQVLGVLLLLWIVFAAVNGIRFGWALDPADYVRLSLVLVTASFLDYVTRPRETRSLSGLPCLQLATVGHRQTLDLPGGSIRNHGHAQR